MVLFGSSCISWCAHEIHISLPANPLLDSGTHNVLFLELNKESLIGNADLIEIILPGFRIGPLVNLALYVPHGISILGSTSKLLNCMTTSVFSGTIAAHHFFVGVVFIIVGLIGYLYVSYYSALDLLQHFLTQWHGQLSVILAIHGHTSTILAHHLSAIQMYAFGANSYPTVLCLFYHHMWVGGFLIIGAGGHASLCIIASKTISINSVLIKDRDPIIGHLIWVIIALGFHGFSLYCHNDTLEGFGRPEDIFHDNSIQLKPVLSFLFQQQHNGTSFGTAIEMLDKKLICISQELGTADFIVHHIHAFTIHVTLLILSKGLLYARNSRFVSDKFKLGFRYPCDGPGRGGTCQISPLDHLYLAVFWMYNCLDLFIFSWSWKMQSDVWGIYNLFEQQIPHISGGDFSVNATTINGWLRNYLWSQAAQVIQSYGLSSISPYGFIFISGHFIWAFSLMFLYSGRAYWQELIESIVWAHHKLKIMPHIQPRALSISQGRAVGLIHYTLGGVGCTWAFIISRMVGLTT